VHQYIRSGSTSSSDASSEVLRRGIQFSAVKPEGDRLQCDQMQYFLALLLLAASVPVASWSNRLVPSRVISSAAVAVGLMSTPVPSILLPNDSPLMSVFIQPANADVRAQQKRTYFRFIPKLNEGTAFFKNELKQAIDKEDWKVLEKAFEVYVSKYNKNDPNQIDATDTYINVHFYRPMTLFAGSFAERGSSPKTKAMMEQEALFEEAMGNLEGCIKDRKGSGFFAADIKMPTGAAKKKLALESYAKAKESLNEYIKIGNTGLMLELNKIDTI